ncbi:glycerate kinase [Hypoxylon sp. NC0597]|nr:glycerate kinase [Hypoxylon sp. NC0597]
MRQLRILVAPSGFNKSLESEKVADCIEEGIRRVFPEKSAIVHKAPLYDGGDNLTQALSSFNDSKIRDFNINSPFYYPIPSHLVFIDGGNTAVLDVAAAAGPQFIVENCPDSTATTSYGIGELIAAAVEAGCTKIIVDCGDSAALDGGAGMLQALGARLLDANGEDIITIGGAPELSRLVAIDLSNIHSRLRKKEICIEAVYDTENVLCGDNGVAFDDNILTRASFEQVEDLSLALERFANLADEILRVDVGNKPGSGISGGLGTGLMLLGARFRSRHDVADEYFDFETLFDKPWDLVITGAGLFSSQSSKANMSRKLSKLAQKHGVHAIAVVETIAGERAADIYEEGVSSLMATHGGPAFLQEKTDELIKDAAQRAMRMVQIGISLNQGQIEPQVKGVESAITHLDLSQTDLTQA